MKQVQTILVNFLGINVSKLVSIFIGFIITLFVTRILGPGGYGIVTLLYMIESILIVVFQSGFGQSIGRYIAISKGKGEKYNLIVAAGIAIAFISSALVYITMFLLANIIKEYSKKVGVVGILVYNFLDSLADDNQSCFPSQKYIAECLGYSRATINRAVKTLEKNGLLKIKKRDRYHLIYYLCEPRCKVSETQMSNTGNSDVNYSD